MTENPQRFRPTPSMFRCKALLHRACPPEMAVNLTPSDPKFAGFVRPFSLLQIQKWLELFGEEFWEFLITPPNADGLEIETRTKAYETVLQIFALDDGTPETMKLKLDAAKLLLAARNPLVAIQNNNATEALPRGLRGKTISQQEERLAQLTKHIPRPELTGTIDAEVE